MENHKEYFFYEQADNLILDQFQETFGGERVQDRLVLTSPEVNLDLFYYEFVKGFSIHLNSFQFKQDNILHIEGKTDDPSIVLRFDYAGNFFDTIHIGSTGGMRIYNNDKSFSLQNSAHLEYKWLSIRLSKSVIEKDFQLLLPLFDVLKEGESWLIFDIVPLEVHMFLKDIFELDSSKSEIYKKRIIISRAIECLGVFYERLLNRDSIEKNNLHTDDQNMLLKIKDLILSDYTNTPSIENLAYRYGYSASKFKRDFKKLFGKPVHRFHIEYKLEKAKQLLILENRTVTEVSRLVGYKSLAKFSVAFKQQFGVSPKAITK